MSFFLKGAALQQSVASSSSSSSFSLSSSSAPASALSDVSGGVSGVGGSFKTRVVDGAAFKESAANNTKRVVMQMNNASRLYFSTADPNSQALFQFSACPSSSRAHHSSQTASANVSMPGATATGGVTMVKPPAASIADGNPLSSALNGTKRRRAALSDCRAANAFSPALSSCSTIPLSSAALSSASVPAYLSSSTASPGSALHVKRVKAGSCLRQKFGSALPGFSSSGKPLSDFTRCAGLPLENMDCEITQQDKVITGYDEDEDEDADADDVNGDTDREQPEQTASSSSFVVTQLVDVAAMADKQSALRILQPPASMFELSSIGRPIPQSAVHVQRRMLAAAPRNSPASVPAPLFDLDDCNSIDSTAAPAQRGDERFHGALESEDSLDSPLDLPANVDDDTCSTIGGVTLRGFGALTQLHHQQQPRQLLPQSHSQSQLHPLTQRQGSVSGMQLASPSPKSIVQDSKAPMNQSPQHPEERSTACALFASPQPAGFLPFSSSMMSTPAPQSNSFPSSSFAARVNVVSPPFFTICSLESALEELENVYVDGLFSGERRYQADAMYFQFQEHIDESSRPILFEWMMEVCQEYFLSRETTHLAFSYVDRFLSLSPSESFQLLQSTTTRDPFKVISKQNLQLLGVACMAVAAKLEEIYAPSFKEYCETTDGAFDERQMAAMERNVLEVVGFSLHAPTPVTWLKLILKMVVMRVDAQCEWLYAQIQQALANAPTHVQTQSDFHSSSMSLWNLLRDHYLQVVHTLLSTAFFERCMLLIDWAALNPQCLKFYPSALAMSAFILTTVSSLDFHAQHRQREEPLAQFLVNIGLRSQSAATPASPRAAPCVSSSAASAPATSSTLGQRVCPASSSSCCCFDLPILTFAEEFIGYSVDALGPCLQLLELYLAVPMPQRKPAYRAKFEELKIPESERFAKQPHYPNMAETIQLLNQRMSR